MSEQQDGSRTIPSPSEALAAEAAVISTATVEVKTLTLSGKQMTLAVFRQLPFGSLIDPDGYLAGRPWGHVNYHPDGCKKLSWHRHVVWQRDGALYRDMVHRPRRTAHGRICGPEINRYVQSLYCDSGHRSLPEGFVLGADAVFFSIQSQPCGDVPWMPCWAMLPQVEHADTCRPFDAEWGALLPVLELEEARRTRHHENRLAIFDGDLPQLFIAI